MNFFKTNKWGSITALLSFVLLAWLVSENNNGELTALPTIFILVISLFLGFLADCVEHC